MFCPQCGKELKADVIFCNGCGKRLQKEPEVSTTPAVAQTPTVVQVPTVVQKPAVVQAPADTPAPKEKKPSIFTKDNFTKAGLILLSGVLYALVAVLFLFIININDTISIKTLFDDDISKHMTLNELLIIMIKGNRIFNPTAISTALGIWTYLLIFSLPVFALISYINILISKKSNRLHIVFCVIVGLSAVTNAVITPVSVKLVSGLKQAISVSVGILPEDIDTFGFIPLIIASVIAVVITVISTIVIFSLRKRRGK